MNLTPAIDYLVIGAGFYGCSLALFLRSVSNRIVVVEAGSQPMNRASRVNQARVHTGFHYPRNVMTAIKSMVLHRRFASDFPQAIDDNFQMLYAIARRRSKISAKRFYRMFSDMGAPIAPADPSQAALFNPSAIEAVFACTERAFDYSVLRDHMMRQFDALDVDLLLNTEVRQLEERDDDVIAWLSSGSEIRARFVFNVTYSQINSVLRSGALPEASLKHELAEIALIRPPRQLEGYGITVMDGPFFSVMPYPPEKLYSLTHVRYTPHTTWTDSITNHSSYRIFESLQPETYHRNMILDGQRYLPCLTKAKWIRSIYDVKTVLVKNESDDGRPVLFHRQPQGSRIISIMGGKIDNIYDLFDLVRLSHPEWADAHSGHVHAGPLIAGVAV
ncbi:FAD-dependent oxidoreductase [Bradyrhizobium archetypum]|uniref:FAD-dependent oxidoreductase n=1 Tax=Bradyrhizobium archetypum TaxID=2721160 RepID=A0A7Y4HBE3_9BRAD|nr:FAD-dependent oxidoreductase [Bradyrhizobium archetypum]NOJ50948.1 FAD-dependent oxidoreductase [Bradyrhizobium archetypum]